MYVPALAERTSAESKEEREAAHSPHCWCNCTLSETGPDDQPVGFQVCGASRPCFEE